MYASGQERSAERDSDYEEAASPAYHPAVRGVRHGQRDMSRPGDVCI